MITEEDIEEVIALFESEDFEDSFATEEEMYWNYLNSDSFKGLSSAEHQMLFFINSVIYHSCKDLLSDEYEFDIEEYQTYEEDNWAIREDTKKWGDTLDLYFEDYSQEDLLAFVEDMLAQDEDESELSDLGREVIFITAKSYIDFFVGDD